MFVTPGDSLDFLEKHLCQCTSDAVGIKGEIQAIRSGGHWHIDLAKIQSELLNSNVVLKKYGLICGRKSKGNRF